MSSSKITDRNIWVVYGAILLLGTAYGIAVSLIAHHLDGLGFDKIQLGSLASWFAFGIASFSLPVGRLIGKTSAKAVLVACLVGYAATVSLFPTLRSYSAIAVDRFFDGAFSVGIWVSCETILLARAERDMKARVTSLYAVSIAIGYVVGPLIAEGIIHVATMGDAFWVSGALAVLATLLVVLRLDPDPAVAERNEEASQPDADRAVTPQITLLRRIKTSCFATFAYGYFQSSVIPFLPLYLVESKGIDRKVTILVPFFFALGMLLFSNVAGRLGDRLGHLLVMRALGAVGTSMILGFVALQSFPLMAIAVFVAGATLASISPVSLALQGVVTEPRDYNRSNAIYNAFYALGMLAGPCVSSLVFARLGGGAMLIHLAGLWIAFVLFTILFRGDDPAFRATPSGDASALGVGAVGNAASLRCEAVQIGPSHQVRVRLDEA